VHAPVQPPIIDPDLLMLAYKAGIFPMADHRDDPEVFWVEPRRRAILPLDGLRVSRSLARTLRRGRFRVTCDAAFRQVLDACAAPRQGDGGESWISRRIAASYERLHELGHAHSVECWSGGELVGGLYGVEFGGVFCGESMFSRASDASKVALCWLVAAMRLGGYQLLDCQFMTEHLASLGAVEISQKRYVRLLASAQRAFALSSARPMSGVGDGEGGGGLAAGAGDPLAAGAGLPAAFGALLARAEGVSSSPGNFIAQSLTQTS
jgi:leucyl/phenylalanyl-tRNA--protein transferase